LPATARAKKQRPDMKVIAMYLAPANMRTYDAPSSIGPLNIPTWMPRAVRKWLWNVIDKRFIDPVLLPYLNEVRRQHDLTPVGNFIDHMQSIADCSIALFPTWFCRQKSEWPKPMYSANFQLYDPNEAQGLSSEMTEFLEKGEAPIIFTPGTANRQATKYFKHALDATQRLGRRAIFLTLFPEQIPNNLPDSILWQPYHPLIHLLPYAAAIVHHGGIGTTAEALRAGIPQLIIPMAHDQFDNAFRVQAFGVGDFIFHSRLNTRKLYTTLKYLLASKSVHLKCRKIAGYFPKHPNEQSLYDFIN
jgi:rhamnosyltransferase subunit B